ncbi:hypothetical protein [Phreatobacter stygius]|uniref:Antibiotic biosynthesis monooxygenase n=1 Tax=Phreatobacter stygius TaxID=1940610 RepID=A0A4D7B500_9HYPH|nr:hypothetical protein [Phreatobacter stygius]QCI63097.1 hypothetical protein E8M01_01910 [Phreatobacter stygius]
MTSETPTGAVAVARLWRGRTRRDRADAYETYLYDEGVAELGRRALGVQMLRREAGDETEFVVMSFWESVAAMSRFAGADPTRIRHLDRDAEYLIGLPDAVEVFEVKSSSLPGAFLRQRG